MDCLFILIYEYLVLSTESNILWYILISFILILLRLYLIFNYKA